ncbi:Zinc finger protein 510 [Frankliniella fusca]|uniref:Zinc finger protein 510 n=1 Tax=Frankliniella fusca TaxID=407009 RepID=A0AAE1I1M4_9NEOP|nr:Zinc finger protein 510 [Frankliniella fusca]
MGDGNDSFLDISQCSGYLLTSTPPKNKTFKTPAALKVGRRRIAAKGPICGICHICGKEYVRKRSFDDHMRLHVLVDVNSRYPNKEKIIEEAGNISQITLRQMMSMKGVGKWGGEHNMLLQRLTTDLKLCVPWQDFYKTVTEKYAESLCTGKYLLPSSLLPIICKISDKILGDRDMRDRLLQLLLNSVDFSSQMLECFVCEFVLCFGEQIISFLCKSVVGEKPSKPKENVVFDIEDRQVIYYVAGSVMRRMLRYGIKHSKNEDWNAIKNTIETRIDENGQGVEKASEADRAWTGEINRKSLFFIGSAAMDFFVSLTQVLYNIESDKDGNFKTETVVENVYEDGVTLLLWDELVGSSLHPDLSIRFLKGVTKSFTQTYAKGAALKKLNGHLKKAFVAISLRHSIAPRQ